MAYCQILNIYLFSFICIEEDLELSVLLDIYCLEVLSQNEHTFYKSENTDFYETTEPHFHSYYMSTHSWQSPLAVQV
jgi:hypothetical protein